MKPCCTYHSRFCGRTTPEKKAQPSKTELRNITLVAGSLIALLRRCSALRLLSPVISCRMLTALRRDSQKLIQLRAYWPTDQASQQPGIPILGGGSGSLSCSLCVTRFSGFFSGRVCSATKLLCSFCLQYVSTCAFCSHMCSTVRLLP